MQPSETFSTELAVCYEVLLFLASRMAKLAPGEVLEFISCDPNARDEVAEWSALHEYELLAADDLPDGRIRFLIRR